jgi:putative metallohydrolase (TIGR04338 family)
MRDTQRQRLYDAEAQVCRQLELAAAGARLIEVAGSTLAPRLEVRFGSMAAAQAYVDRVRGLPAYAAIFPVAARVPIRVRLRAGDRAAHYEAPGTIALHEPVTGAAWALRELVVLHELAHHGQHHDHEPGAPHGPAYAGALLRLVGAVMGPEVGLLLMSAFADHRVGWHDQAPGLRHDLEVPA